MNKIMLLIMAFVIVSSTNYVFAEQEYDYDLHPIDDYDLSSHPIFQPYDYDSDSSYSSEIYSPPAVSSQHDLERLNVNYDPTIRYFVYATSSFDYCDLEYFSNYPKCFEQITQNEFLNKNISNLEENNTSNISEIDVRQLFALTGMSYDSLPSWMKFNLEMWIKEDNVDSEEIVDAIETFVESSSWN